MANVSALPKPGYYKVTRGKLVAHVRHGYVLVPCHGDAHKLGNRHLESCGLCLDGPWGWCVVRAAQPAEPDA